MSKILAIDYGTKNIGLAMSDTEQKIAFPYATLHVKTPRKNVGSSLALAKIINDIKNICQIEKVEKIIIGLPTWLTGDNSATTDLVFDFAKELEQGTGLKVETIDERYSTVQANKMINSAKDGSAFGGKTARNIDELSAQILLAGYLEKINNL